MEPRYWQEILDMFFVRGWNHGQTSMDFNHGALFDDMLFFVRTMDEVARNLSFASSVSHIPII